MAHFLQQWRAELSPPKRQTSRVGPPSVHNHTKNSQVVLNRTILESTSKAHDAR